MDFGIDFSLFLVLLGIQLGDQNRPKAGQGAPRKALKCEKLDERRGPKCDFVLDPVSDPILDLLGSILYPMLMIFRWDFGEYLELS